MIAELIYGLCALTSCLCAVLLVRQYRRSPVRLLLWSSLAFVGLAINNLLLVVDFQIGPLMDLSMWRTGVALAALLVLLVGLIGEFR